MKKTPLFVPLLLALAVAPQAGAITLAISGGVDTSSTSSFAACENPYYGTDYTDCSTTAFVSSSLAGPNSYFQSLSTFGGGSSLGEESFASALASSFPQYSNVTWDPTGLSGITLTVTNFSASTNFGVGGIGNITVTVSGNLNNPGDPSIDQLMWIQGLEINYQPGLAGDPSASFDTSTTFNVMDTSEFDNFGNCENTTQGGNPDDVPANTNPATGQLPNTLLYCGPIYPFQYTNAEFFDAPAGPWPNGSFRGIALLGTIDTQDDSLVLYGGVSYGFDNSVAPEPGTWVLLLAGAGLLGLLRRRRACNS